MRKILILLLLSTGVFAQQISVQNNELKYRTSSGIATAANKDSVAAQIANVSFDTTSLSNRIDFKVNKVTGKGLSTNDYSNAAVVALSTNTTNIGLLQADRNTLFTSVATKVNSTQVGNQIADSLSGFSGGGGDVSLSANNAFTGRNTFSGNTILGSTVDSGEKLQVNGSSKFTGDVDISSGKILWRGNSLIENSLGNAVGDVYLSARVLRSQAATGDGMLINYNSSGSGNAHLRLFAGGTNERMRINATSGNVILGSITDISSAILNVNSTTKGFLPPRMTDTQKDAISAPAEGLMIYQTTATKGWYGYNGTAWVILN